MQAQFSQVPHGRGYYQFLLMPVIKKRNYRSYVTRPAYTSITYHVDDQANSFTDDKDQCDAETLLLVVQQRKQTEIEILIESLRFPDP